MAVVALLAAAAVTGYFVFLDLNVNGGGRSVPNVVEAPRSPDAPVRSQPPRDNLASVEWVEHSEASAPVRAGVTPTPLHGAPATATSTPGSAGTARHAALPTPTVSVPRPNDSGPGPIATRAEDAQAEPRRVAAPSPSLQASPTPDRWQAMSEAVAKCAREGVLAGFLCGERVRLQYCEGHWGAAPQCPTANRNEYGS